MRLAATFAFASIFVLAACGGGSDATDQQSMPLSAIQNEIAQAQPHADPRIVNDSVDRKHADPRIVNDRASRTPDLSTDRMHADPRIYNESTPALAVD